MSTLNRLPSRPPARAVVFDLTPEIAEISAELAYLDDANLAGLKMVRTLAFFCFKDNSRKRPVKFSRLMQKF